MQPTIHSWNVSVLNFTNWKISILIFCCLTPLVCHHPLLCPNPNPPFVGYSMVGCCNLVATWPFAHTLAIFITITFFWSSVVKPKFKPLYPHGWTSKLAWKLWWKLTFTFIIIYYILSLLKFAFTHLSTISWINCSIKLRD